MTRPEEHIDRLLDRFVRFYAPHTLIARIASGLRARWINRGVTELPW